LNSPRPPAELIKEGLNNLHDHLFKNRLQLDPLDSAGIFAGTILMLNAYQGETILVARIVSLAVLKRAGLMDHSVINVGRVLETRKPQITEAMSRLRNDGDWEEWIAEFAEILSQAAEETSRFNQQITDLYLSDKDKAASLGRPAESIHRVLEILIEFPITTSNFLVQKTGLTPATVNKSLRHLSDLGVIHELTSRRRNRIFLYTAVLDLLFD
jgi:Fic family protein